MLRSLKIRFALWFSFVATFSVAVLLVIARFALEAQVVRSFELINEVEFKEICDILEDQNAIRPPNASAWTPKHPARLTAEEFRNVLGHDMETDQQLFYFEIFLPDETLIYRSDNLGGIALSDPVSQKSSKSVRHEKAGELLLTCFNWKGLHIHIASSMSLSGNFYRSYDEIACYLVAGTLALSLLLSRHLSRLALDPIARLEESARHISATDLGQRLPVPDGPREVSQLAAYLNEMFDRMESSFEQVRRFSAEASHELRTPLALIRLQAEKLLKNPGLGAEESDAVAEILDETGRLNRLIEGLLLLTRAEAGAISLNLQRMDGTSFLADFSEDATLLAEDAGKKFVLEVNEEAPVRADPQWLRHVLLNLLSNALKFTPPGSTVRLSGRVVGMRWRVSFDDEGPGVPEAWLSRMFERFARVPRKEGEPEVAGTGLGLAICRSIVERHGGVIRAELRGEGKGLRVYFEIGTVSLENSPDNGQGS